MEKLINKNLSILRKFGMAEYSDNVIILHGENHYHWVVVEATGEERAKAAKQARRILVTCGFPEPVMAKTTTQEIVLFPYNAPYTTDAINLVTRLLQCVSLHILADAKINTTTAATTYYTIPATCDIAKPCTAITGTLADATLMRTCDRLTPAYPEPQEYNGYDPRSFLVSSILPQPYKTYKCGTAIKYLKDGTLIIQLKDGRIAINDPVGLDWETYRKSFYETPEEAAARILEEEATRPNSSYNDSEIDKSWLTTDDFWDEPRPPKLYVRTGIHELDRACGKGLIKGTLTVMSGQPGCGKSTLLSQMSLSAIEAGNTVAVFSGELSRFRYKDWMTLQAAGLDTFVREDGSLGVTRSTSTQIGRWLRGKLYLYNNSRGMSGNQILDECEQLMGRIRTDLLILDNLSIMSVGTEEGENQWNRQSDFIKRILVMAQKYNTAVILVAHPRKVTTMMRYEDISGSASIGNLADTILLLHRNKDDFRTRAQQMFHWADNDERLECDNLLEIAKDRENGTVDKYIPLYYNHRCKRLENWENENRTFSYASQVLAEEK